MDESRNFKVLYFAQLREKRGLKEEELESLALTPRDLYEELQEIYSLDIDRELILVAINNQTASWDYVLQDGDTVAFIPPVAGG